MTVARIARLAAVLLVWTAAALQAQSLWSPGFSGYITGHNSLETGDLVAVKIDTKTKLAYSSSQVSSRNLTIEFSGGAAPNILSFLPQGQTGNKSNLKDGEELDLSTVLGAKVVRLDSSGNAFIEGARTVDIGHRQESITVTGWLNPSMLSSQGQVPFDQLADSKLVFQTGLSATAPVLTPSDITQVLSQVQGAFPALAATAGASSPPGAPVPGAATGTGTSGGAAATGTGASGSATATGTGTAPAPPSASAAVPASPAAPTYTLTEQKKRELLLQYLNDMLSLIFSGSGK